MATATDCDFFARVAGGPNGQEEFLNKPNALVDLYHFTSHDEHDVYDAVDFRKHPELRQDGKVVVVTGARGIGRAIAVAFAQAGAKAVAVGARTQSQLEETKREIEAAGSHAKVHIQQLDVTSDESVQSFFAAVKEQFGTIDTAVSNAGINNNQLPVAHTDTDTWWNEIEVNFKGSYLMTKYFVQQLGEKSGTIINISSTNALAVIPTQSAYITSKLATMRMLEHIHFENPNVRVFSVHPGLVDTEMQRRARDAYKWAWTSDTSELVGAVSVFLTTPKAEFLRGRWISVNWRVDELEARKEEILQGNLLKTAFNAKLGC